MSSLGARLRKLEVPPEDRERIREACERLFRYCIETRHQVKGGNLPEFAWHAEEEAAYQEWAKDPGFAEREREILANPSYREMNNER